MYFEREQRSRYNEYNRTVCGVNCKKRCSPLSGGLDGTAPRGRSTGPHSSGGSCHDLASVWLRVSSLCRLRVQRRIREVAAGPAFLDANMPTLLQPLAS